MIVISLSTVPAKLRGYLSIYLWEIDTNVFVGDVSTRVRELLWKRVEEAVRNQGRAIIVYPSDSEQGFDFKTCGTSFRIVDYEGLKLVMRPTERTLSAEILPREIKKISRRSYHESYVVLDMETTGLDVEKDRIIEIGAIRVLNGEVVDTYNCIVKSDIPIPSNITEVTGLTQADLDAGMPVKTAIQKLRSFLGNQCVIGYNIVNYDVRILHYECIRNNVEYPFVRVIDVLPIAKQAIVGLSSYSLGNVAAVLNLKLGQRHRAISDCYLCNDIYQKLFDG